MSLGSEFKQCVRIVPLTTTDANDLEAAVTGFDTAIDLLMVDVNGYTVANDDASSQEYYENTIPGGVTLALPKVSKKWNVLTNSLESNASGAKDKLKFKAFISVAQREAIKALKGKLLAIVAFTTDITGAIVYEEHLIGKLSGDIDFSSENAMMKFENEIVGKAIAIDGGSTVTHAEYNTAVTTATITPVTGTAITPTAIIAGDFTVLKTGLIQSVVTS